MNNHVKWIFNHWKQHKFYIVFLFILTLLSTTVTVAYPIVFKKYLDVLSQMVNDHVKPDESLKQVYNIIKIFIAIGLAKLVVSTYPSFRALMNLIFEYVLRKKYFDLIIEKDYKFFANFRTGDLVTRLTNDMSEFGRISWFMCSGIFRALDSFIKICFCMGVMFSMNWELTLYTIAPLPFMIVVFYFTSGKVYTTFDQNQKAISDINNQLELSFSGVRIIKAFVCEQKYRRFFENALDNRFKTEMNVVKLNTFLHLIYEYIDRFAIIGVILFGGYMVVKGEVSIGTFYAFYTYLSMLIYPILDLPQLFVSAKQAFVCIDRLDEIADYPVDNSLNKGSKIDSINSVEFNDIEFIYPEKKKPALKKISFKLNKGEKVAIFGPIGSGKTTIMNLLSGILIPQNGKILVNDRNLDNIDIVSLRELIGYVPQEALLFSGSIKDNVNFGSKQEDPDHYKRSLNASQLSDEIAQFGEKDETIIGQRGLSLSGGQKQRLAIARALYRKPQLLLLDDITASLDADNEEKLWKEINIMAEDITGIVISHRLSTLRYVDRVIFLEKGEIFGDGTHNVLYNTIPEYRSFIDEHLK